MAAVYRGYKKGYALTDTDVLWLARAFVGEFEGNQTRRNAAVHFWCWMQRFLFVNGIWMKRGDDFWEFLRAHSQAINLIWMTAGEKKCANSSTGACSPESIKRRHRICALGPGDMKKAYAWALEAQAGTLEHEPSKVYYNFAACSAIKKNQKWRPCPGDDFDGQCFLGYECLSENEHKSIYPGEVTIVGAVEKSIGWTIAGLVTAGLVGWAIYTLARR